MASNIGKRLDRLEKLASALLNADKSPVYCREGEEPEGVSPERLVIIPLRLSAMRMRFDRRRTLLLQTQISSVLTADAHAGLTFELSSRIWGLSNEEARRWQPPSFSYINATR
jgi:hypothetical protein